MSIARILSIERDAEILADLKSPVQVKDSREYLESPHIRNYVIKLTGVHRYICSRVQANVVCAYDGEKPEDCTDIIIAGTRQQMLDVADSLAREAGYLAIVDQIRDAIDRWEGAPPQPLYSQYPSLFDQMRHRTLIMGILNVTPDSFSDGGLFVDTAAAVDHARRMVHEGADIIDVGGESTKPGADPVPLEQELARVIPVISELAGSVDVPISIDTYKAEVARAALDAGVGIVNDISAATFDPEMPALIAERGCPIVIMHIKGTPRNMQLNPTYENVLDEVYQFLAQRIESLISVGVDERQIIIDPGIGFGKTVKDNLLLMRRLREFACLGRPILVGTSRKSTIGKVLGDLPVEERLEGTAATVAVSIMNGANIVRVHDVREMTRVAKMTDAIMRA